MIGVRAYLRLRRALTPARGFPFSAGRRLLRLVDAAALRLCPPEVRVRQHFNRWAKQGAGERMERDHLYFTEQVLNAMSVSPADRVLDLGCGDGWACRLIADRAGASCRMVGLDVSDEMVQRAAALSRQFRNLTFVCGSAERLPYADGSFTKVLSVSAFYYIQGQERALAELFRVVAPGGRLFILTYNYKDRPEWRRMAHELGVPVRVRSAAEYARLFEAAAWGEVRTQELWREGREADEAGTHRRALLVSAQRPSAAPAVPAALEKAGPASKR